MAATMRLPSGLLLSMLLAPLGCSSGDVSLTDGSGTDDASGDAGFPGETASCDEMVRFLVAYAEAHGDCTSESDCVPGIAVSQLSCLSSWVNPGLEWLVVPALRADATWEAFAAFRDRLAGCCPWSRWGGGGDGWSCSRVADAGFATVDATCDAGRCIGRVEFDVSSCMRDARADIDADATDDGDAVMDETADDETDEGDGDAGHECESDMDCPAAGPCMRTVCDPATHRCCGSTRPDETPCDDGLYCNGTERCVAGVCTTHLFSVPCDRDPCWLSVCNEAADSCSTAVPAPAGRPCRLEPGECVAGTCDGTGACVDVATPVCPAECCTDRRDNDGDLAVDCEDADCLDDPGCTPCRPGPEICWDGCDNDGDGRTDGHDDDCTCFAPCLSCACRPGPEICDNNCDDDRDRLPDCVDPDCAADLHCSGCVPTAGDESTMGLCTDGRDNDCDGFTDCCDFPGDCAYHIIGCDVGLPENCRNYLDDDFDGLIDCDDSFDCGATPWCSCAVWAPEDCDDGIDNDRDGLTDLDDPDCPRECG